MTRTSRARQADDNQPSAAARKRRARAGAARKDSGGAAGAASGAGAPRSRARAQRAAGGKRGRPAGGPDGAAPAEPSEDSRRFRLDHGPAIGDEIARMARGRIAHATDELTGVSGSAPDKAVHEARKDMKKLRALVRLVRDGLGEELYRYENARFRDAARRLSDVRDADVMLAALASLEDLPEGIASSLREALQEHRASLDAELGGGLDEARREVAGTLAEARDAVAGWPLRRDGFRAIEGGLCRIYSQGRRRFRTAVEEPSAENLHEWRKRVKDHWYHLTILEDLWQPPMEALAGEAHVLSERLGDDHDLAVLRDWAHERADGLDLEPLDESVERRRAELQADAVAIGRRLYGENAGAFSTRMRTWFDAWRAGLPELVH